MGAPGEARPVIQGGGEALHLTDPRYVILQNLEILGTADNGINVDDGGQFANPEAARFVLFRDLDIHDTWVASYVTYCLKISGLNDFFVLGSSFALRKRRAEWLGWRGWSRGAPKVRFNRFGQRLRWSAIRGGTGDRDHEQRLEHRARGVNMGAAPAKRSSARLCLPASLRGGAHPRAG
jgi:hypothetical protein